MKTMIYHYWLNHQDRRDGWFDRVQVLCGVRAGQGSWPLWKYVTCEDCLNHPDAPIHALKAVEL